MSTPIVVNIPGTDQSSDNGMGFFLGIVVLIIVGLSFFYYGMPMIRQSMNGGVQINVPKDINVKVNQTK